MESGQRWRRGEDYFQGRVEEGAQTAAPRKARGRPVQRMRRRHQGMVEDGRHKTWSDPASTSGRRVITSRDSSRTSSISCWWRCMVITYTTIMGFTWTGTWQMKPFGRDAGGGWPLSCPGVIPPCQGPLVRGSPRAWQRNGEGSAIRNGTPRDPLSFHIPS